ncbi:MAG: hypothetical protein V2I34_02480 [Bacteroidales bacterium]|jgi:hypothetical protein|nr:hypothetical protein [Bacteroidales bacterium]
MGRIQRILYLPGLLFITAVLLSCDREPENIYSGEFIIDNTLYVYGQYYYATGFSFEEGEERRTIDTPGPDITVHAYSDAQGAVSGAYLDTPNLVASFALAGDFPSAAEAKTFYDKLLTAGSYSWTLSANDIGENQVYVFRTRKDNYVKFRIKELLLDDTDEGPYAEVTIEWQIQPDGSATFSR